MRWLLGIVINAVLFIALAGFFKESFYIESFFAALGASFVLSVLNIFIKPILIILTLPVTVFTLGLFLFVINAVTLLLTDSIMGSSFEIDGFGTSFLIAIIMSFVNIIIQQQLMQESKNKKE
ncbi:phage holin family protein [Bacillus sp. V3B]|uniref:phage holin family protein n=1 Tax=Bacillus sp. V3B TaxID=2804915 RepID=UPI00210AA067|nr:phage holin family protein [Bacillus sp. V3B]MCQ6275706.1 phage holin family protein [Bacillus sp. V3B]